MREGRSDGGNCSNCGIDNEVVDEIKNNYVVALVVVIEGAMMMRVVV